jgi:hypothetical protein
MKLQGDYGITVELDAVGYQNPQIEGDYLGSNWLIIHGRVEHPQGAWSFNRSCLTTIEVEHLIRWFEAIGQYSDLIPTSFIEPNLEFSYTSSPSAAIQILLTRECAPPWLTDKRQRAEGIILSVPADKDNLLTNIGSLREWLARYPIRASKILSRRETVSFSAVINNINEKSIMTVSGFSGDSSMIVFNITRQELGDKLLIIARETLSGEMLIRRGLTRKFEYSIEIKGNINYVCFGSLSDVVWHC